jgi:hypothetical protein
VGKSYIKKRDKVVEEFQIHETIARRDPSRFYRSGVKVRVNDREAVRIGGYSCPKARSGSDSRVKAETEIPAPADPQQISPSAVKTTEIQNSETTSKS